MNIILLGIQGSGKGTLVSDLEKEIDFNLISVGQLLRDEVATGSEEGKHIHELQTAGILVELDIVMRVLNKKLSNKEHDITIFDGFPRNTEQADKLDNITKVDLAIHLNLNKEIAIERLVNRLNCSSCGFIANRMTHDSDICPQCGGKLVQRSDDTIEGISKRFELYELDTLPLIQRYRERGVLVEIDANQTPEERKNAVLKVINEYKY